MAEEPLRKFIIEASRRRALESRSHPTTTTHIPIMPLAGGLLAGALLFSGRKSFARTAMALGICGYLGAMIVRQRGASSCRGEMRCDEVANVGPPEGTGVDAASSMSFPASDPPATTRGAANSVEFAD